MTPFRELMKGALKFIPCGDSLLVILLGVTVAIVGIGNSILLLPRIIELQGKEEVEGQGGEDSRLHLYCEIFAVVFVAIICRLVHQSCVDLEEMQAKIDDLDRKEKDKKNPYRLTFRELVKGFLLKGVKWIDMSQQRRCFYNQHRRGKELNIAIGEPIPVEWTYDGFSFVPITTELSGITLRQLKAVDANASRRCVEEMWIDEWTGQPVTPETMNLYNIHKYVVKPFTKFTQKSFVESLPSTAGTQPPRIFINNRWATPFKDTIACIEQMIEDFKWNRNDEDEARGGGMTEDTPIWMYCFANNDWALNEETPDDFMKSPTGRTMKVSCFRTMSILDSQCIAFTRILVVGEIFVTLKNNGLWAIYTAHEHSVPSIKETRSAIGIVLGGAPGEAADESYIREENFPPELIKRSFQFKVAKAEARDPKQLTLMLNIISGSKNLHDAPPSAHDAYNQLEDAVRGAFAASVPALKAALPKDKNTEDDKQWKDMLVALSKGTQKDTFKLDFNAFRNPSQSSTSTIRTHELLPSLSSICANELVSHLPPTYTGLLFTHATGETAIGMVGGMMKWLTRAKVIKELICFNCKVGDEEEGERLGSQLANELTESRNQCTETIEHLYMTNTDLIVPGNIAQWATALKRMKSLKILYLDGVAISEEDEKILSDATYESAVTYFKKR